MNKVSLLVVVSVAALSVAACDKKAGDGTTTTTTGSATAAATAAAAAAGGGACMHDETSMCVQYPASLSAAEAKSEKADCEKEKGKWSASCPTANMLGTCTNAKKGGGLAMKLYKGTLFKDAAQAKKEMCSDSGDAFAPN